MSKKEDAAYSISLFLTSQLLTGQQLAVTEGTNSNTTKGINSRGGAFILGSFIRE